MSSETPTDWQRTWHCLHEVLGGKWSFHIIQLLATGGHGFNEMQREIDDITATMLSRRLKQLEAKGFVEKTVEPTTPPSSTYCLTTIGERFAAVLSELEPLVAVVDSEDDATCIVPQL